MRRLIALSLLLPLLVAARDLSSWDRVTALSPGKAVEVTRQTGEPVKGDLVSASPDTITIRGKQGETSVARAEVKSIGAKGSGNAKWLGAAIGGVAGLVVGLVATLPLANEGRDDLKAAGAGAGAAVGAAIGLGIGAGIDGGYKTVYRKP
jgi:hypothetical protein